MGESTAWIDDLEPGDQVFVRTYGGAMGAGLDLAKVERLTATQVVLEGTSTRYQRATGRKVGRSRPSKELVRSTPETRAKWRARAHERKLRRRCSELSTALGRVRRPVGASEEDLVDAMGRAWRALDVVLELLEGRD